MDKKTGLILTCIIVFASILRLAFLSSYPPALNWDEVSHGYNAYSVLKTGADEWGEKFPLFNFRAYGDYPTTLNLYLTIPFIIVMGLSEISIRLPHAIYGIITVFSAYFLAYGLTKRKDIGLISAFLAAVSPWLIFSSRFVLQSNLSVFLVAGSIAFFLVREKNKFFLPLSVFFLILSLFSYHTARIFSPLLLASMIVLYRKEFSGILVKFLAAVFFILLFLILKSPESRARSSVVFIINEGAVNRIIEYRNASKLPEAVKRLIYNRPVYFAAEFSKNYITYFSPQFLFIRGGTQYQFSIPDTGLLHLISLPFFYLGIFILIKKAVKEKDYRLLLAWLILYPIPASLTTEKMAVVRASTLLPLSEIITALGFYYLIDKIKGNYKKALVWIYIAALLVSLIVYLQKYVGSYAKDYSWAWQYGYKQAIGYSMVNYDKFDKIIVTKKYGEPHEFFLFFYSWDPKSFQSDKNLIRFNQSNWWWVDRFDKFYFVNDWQVKDMVLESGGKIDCKNKKCLLIASPDNSPSGWSKIYSVNFLDGKTAFEMFENK